MDLMQNPVEFGREGGSGSMLLTLHAFHFLFNSRWQKKQCWLPLKSPSETWISFSSTVQRYVPPEPASLPVVPTQEHIKCTQPPPAAITDRSTDAQTRLSAPLCTHAFLEGFLNSHPVIQFMRSHTNRWISSRERATWKAEVSTRGDRGFKGSFSHLLLLRRGT